MNGWQFYKYIPIAPISIAPATCFIITAMIYDSLSHLPTDCSKTRS